MEFLIYLASFVPLSLLRAYVFLQLYGWFGKPIYDLDINLVHAAGLLTLISFTFAKSVDLEEKTTEQKIASYIYMIIMPLTMWLFGWFWHLIM